MFAEDDTCALFILDWLLNWEDFVGWISVGGYFHGMFLSICVSLTMFWIFSPLDKKTWYVVLNLYMASVIMIRKCIEVAYRCILFHNDSRAWIFFFFVLFFFFYYYYFFLRSSSPYSWSNVSYMVSLIISSYDEVHLSPLVLDGLQAIVLVLSCSDFELMSMRIWVVNFWEV